MIARILVGIFLFVPVAWALQIMITHWVAVPWWDEWLTPGETLSCYYRGTLHLADFWSQHNESRKLFPRLVYLALYLPTGWDVRYGMALTFAWVCAGSIGLYLLLRQCVSPRVALAGFMVTNLLLFSPREYENFLYGIEGENFTPAFALIFALFCTLRAKSFRTKALVNGLLAFLSTYTCANGMLLWLLAFPVQWKNSPPVNTARERQRWRMIYIVAGSTAIAFYFVGYRHPLDTPSFAVGVSQLPQLLHYLAIWLGNLFFSPAPALVGIVTLVSFLLLAFLSLAKAERNGSIKSSYPWLLLGSYVLISGIVTASGRVGFGPGVAFDVRYTAFTVFLSVAIVGLVCCHWSELKRRGYALIIVLIGSTTLVGAWVFTYEQEMQALKRLTAERRHLELVTAWSLAIPRNPDLKLLSPYSETLARIQTLSDHRALRPRLVKPGIMKLFKGAPHISGAVAGYLDEVSFKTPDRLLVQGWAQIPDQGMAADCVVLGYNDQSGNWTPIGVIETGVSRPDVARAFSEPRLNSSGFSHTFVKAEIPEGATTFEARAIDLKHMRMFRLSGTPLIVKR